MQTRSMHLPGSSSSLGGVLCKKVPGSPPAEQQQHRVHSSDASSGTVKSLEVCSSPGSNSTHRSSPDPAVQAAAAAHHSADLQRSPAPSPVTPIGVPVAPTAALGYGNSVRAQPSTEDLALLQLPPSAAAAAALASLVPADVFEAGDPKAPQHDAAAAGAVKLLDVQPLCAPDPSEGPEAAAEYEAYLKRWDEGDTLAQRWARLKCAGRAVNIQQEWEDMELDLMLQQHCSNTPAAKAARASAAAAMAAAAGAGISNQERSALGRRRSRPDLDAEAYPVEGGSVAAAADTGTEAAAAVGGRRVRARTAPKTFKDFEVELPPPVTPAAKGPTAAAGAYPGTAAGVFFPAGRQKEQPQQQQEVDVYIGAGILWDLHQSTRPTQDNQQQQASHAQLQLPQPQKARQRQQQQCKQRQQQNACQQPQLQLQQQLQPPGPSQHTIQVPAAKPRVNPGPVLDLSGSPRLGRTRHEGSFMASGSSCPAVAEAAAGAAVGKDTQAAETQQQKGWQQQQQAAGLPPTEVRTALQVASQLGAALGHNYEAFAQVISFVTQHSDQPAVLYHFMSTTLAQLQAGQQEADAGAGAAQQLQRQQQQPEQHQQRPRQHQHGLML